MMNQAKTETNNKGIILFDGVCNFCEASVQFIFARDSRQYFRFAPLQSEIGAELQKKYDLANVDSVILIENNRAFARSTAALRIARRLDKSWNWLYAFIFVPEFIRNFVYDLFARNRYRLFGKKEACPLPSPELRKRFLDFVK